ncbi:hypothetical protein COBT_002531 [Conglomerata obtusa]
MNHSHSYYLVFPIKAYKRVLTYTLLNKSWKNFVENRSCRIKQKDDLKKFHIYCYDVFEKCIFNLCPNILIDFNLNKYLEYILRHDRVILYLILLDCKYESFKNNTNRNIKYILHVNNYNDENLVIRNLIYRSLLANYLNNKYFLEKLKYSMTQLMKLHNIIEKNNSDYVSNKNNMIWFFHNPNLYKINDESELLYDKIDKFFKSQKKI